MLCKNQLFSEYAACFWERVGNRSRGQVQAVKFWRGWISGTKQALYQKKPGRRGTVIRPENVEHMRTALDRNPCRSARRHALALHMSWGSLPKILHSDLKVNPYKMQVVQQLTKGDKFISLSHMSVWLRVMAAAVAGPNDTRLLPVGIS